MPDEIVEELRGKKLHPPAKPRDAKDNALMLGEFPVVMDLIKEMPEAAAAKEQVTNPNDTLEHYTSIGGFSSLPSSH